MFHPLFEEAVMRCMQVSQFNIGNLGATHRTDCHGIWYSYAWRRCQNIAGLILTKGLNRIERHRKDAAFFSGQSHLRQRDQKATIADVMDCADCSARYKLPHLFAALPL